MTGSDHIDARAAEAVRQLMVDAGGPHAQRRMAQSLARYARVALSAVAGHDDCSRYFASLTGEVALAAYRLSPAQRRRR